MLCLSCLLENSNPTVIELLVSAALVDEGSGLPLKSAQVSLRAGLHSMMLSSSGREKNKGCL